MNNYRELLLRHMYRLSLLPLRVGKRILRHTIEFVLARPQMMKLTRDVLAYFPILGDLKDKAYAFAGMRETISQSRKTNESYKSHRDNGMKKYTDLSSFLADLQQIEENSSPDDAVKAMCEAYLELTPTDNELTKLDPFSAEYRLAAMRLYEQISGIKNYKPSINERTPYIDIARSVRCPSPYGYSSSKVVGEFISSWGWIFQALDVKQGDKVLEYGAGEGQLSIMLARMGVDVTVIDVDERYLEAIHAQCVSLGINITLKQGEFGDGFEDKKFDRILFFEAFHHAFDHQDVVKKLKSHLTEGGFVVFSGEPIVEAGSVEASLFVPFPWGPRLDGLSVRSSNKFGWCELGFQQGYFVEMLMRGGWLVKYLPCPVTGRGNCYIATPSTGQIELGAPYTILRHGGDAGWHAPEGSYRWTKSHAYLPLPEEIEKNGGQATLTLINHLPIERVVKIGMETNEKICRVYPSKEQVVTVSLSSSRYLQLRTDRVIPSDLIAGSSDHRELGVAVVRVKLH